jgi:hypothetical protein
MAPVPPSASLPHPRAPGGLGVAAPERAPGALLEALHDAMVSEHKLLDDLVAQMRRQRAAVAADDIQAVDDATFGTHRILATLGQARQRRRQLNLLLGGSEDCTLADLEARWGDRLDPRLREARVRLRTVADQLSREVGVNRRLLREVLRGTDQHLRTLVGAPTLAATYRAEPGGDTPPAPPPVRGVLMNRTA